MIIIMKINLTQRRSIFRSESLKTEDMDPNQQKKRIHNPGH